MTEVIERDQRQDADKPQPKYRSFTIRGVQVMVLRRALEDFRVQRLLLAFKGFDESRFKDNPEKVEDLFKLAEQLFGSYFDNVVEQISDQNDGVVPTEELVRITMETVGKLRPNS